MKRFEKESSKSDKRPASSILLSNCIYCNCQVARSSIFRLIGKGDILLKAGNFLYKLQRDNES